MVAVRNDQFQRAKAASLLSATGILASAIRRGRRKRPRWLRVHDMGNVLTRQIVWWEQREANEYLPILQIPFLHPKFSSYPRGVVLCIFFTGVLSISGTAGLFTGVLS